jgi:hypothetical protein
MAILFVGIDLPKNVVAVHGVNDAGKPELVRPVVPRAKLLELFAELPTCTIGMEACTGAHQWARLFQAHSYTRRLMAHKFVGHVPAVGRARQKRRCGWTTRLGSRAARFDHRDQLSPRHFAVHLFEELMPARFLRAQVEAE